MHLILTGATGLVGSSVLDAMIKATDVTKISILSRKPVQMAEDRRDPRVRVILHRDFETYDAAVLDQLRDADGCVWALGISQTKVGADEYVKITKDYTLAAARSFASLRSSDAAAGGDGGPKQQQQQSPKPFRFIYVSGEGATQSPGRFSAIFARVKGETEQALADLTRELPSLQADSVRPAFVDAARHDAIRPYIPDPGMLYRAAMVPLGPLIRSGFKGMHSPTEQLGAFLTQLAAGRLDDKLEGQGAFKLGPSWVVENVGLRRIMGL
ncbi:nucleoside-diphosphate-sugar epimerase [Purpureocillium lavendulum]|uniref:Nucleoside-diphosphate-sugar epimerase n=1 Tax=Purpureocillium lavendulum TaxID=1247861 RepID=A0AB34FV17_9HYPO|nr:nucleoside-diphosphate-sugar epimerase [Purpureocillium lavendulum]